MTAEEVRNQLEELIRDRESFMVGDYDKDIYDRDKETLRAARAIVKKEIPRKITSWTGGSYISTKAHCPYCNRGIKTKHKKHWKYCPNCGQALDWSDENEEDTDAV